MDLPLNECQQLNEGQRYDTYIFTSHRIVTRW